MKKLLHISTKIMTHTKLDYKPLLSLQFNGKELMILAKKTKMQAMMRAMLNLSNPTFTISNYEITKKRESHSFKFYQ